MSGPCWVSRMEDMTGTDDLLDALDLMTQEQWTAVDRIADARLDGKDCGSERPPRSEHDGGCHSGYCVCRWQVLGALCCLEQGHDGPHEFVDTREIVLRFSAAEGAGR
jgi:hypothetical protein